MRSLLQFEPSFMEEAVFWTVRSLEARGESSLTAAYHAGRNSIYPVRDKLQISNGVYEGKGGEAAFREFYGNFFIKLGLRSLFENLLTEFPLLDDPTTCHLAAKRHLGSEPRRLRRYGRWWDDLKTTIFIKRAFGKKEEGSELYRAGDSKNVLLSLQTKRILERSFLEAFVRHEFLRVSDMLDPRFQYSPQISLGGQSPVEENLIRERFRFLWDLYIDQRLGRTSDSKAFQEIAERECWTQGELLELARNERIVEMLVQGGFQCPLCGFHSFERIADWQDRDAFIVREIERDQPDWKPSVGACLQCYELYRSRLKVAV